MPSTLVHWDCHNKITQCSYLINKTNRFLTVLYIVNLKIKAPAEKLPGKVQLLIDSNFSLYFHVTEEINKHSGLLSIRALSYS